MKCFLLLAGGSSSSILQEVQMRIWSNEECREIFRKYVPITNVNLCAGEDGKDACQVRHSLIH